LDRASWTTGVSLIVLTIAIHTTGVVMMAFAGSRIQVRVEKRNPDPLRAIPIVIAHIGVVGLILVGLHGLEAMLWAAGYVWLGAFGSFGDAVLYSNGTMTTLGAPGLTLPSQWQITSALEAVNATLVFGISTAFIFIVMQGYWPTLSRRH
jgi:hypothetical protein